MCQCATLIFTLHIVLDISRLLSKKTRTTWKALLRSSLSHYSLVGKKKKQIGPSPRKCSLKTSSSAHIKALLLICAPFIHTHDHCV